MSHVDIGAIADELLAAYRSGKTIPPLTTTYRGLTAGDAYLIQQRQAGPQSCRATPACTAVSCCMPERAAQRYGVPAHEILQRVGEAGYVGGQQDMIIDIATQLAQERDEEKTLQPH